MRGVVGLGTLVWLGAIGASHAGDVDGGVAALRGEGFTVQEGEYGFFTMESCVKTDTCYAQNPLTPYGLLYLPKSPNEKEEGYHNYCAHGICKRNGTLNAAWRVEPGESVLMVGKSPPKAKYWSINNSLFSRFHKKGWKPSIKEDTKYLSKIINACPVAKTDAGDRCEVFSSLADPVNHLTVKGTGDSSFAAPFAMLITWDKIGEQRALETLEKSAFGFPINVYRLPGSILNLGTTGGHEDDFISVTRVEGIENEADRKAFYSGDWDLRVFRLTLPSSIKIEEDDFHATNEGSMIKRETNRNEQAPGIGPNKLALYLRQLQRKVLAKIRAQGLSTSRVQFDSFVKENGYECLHEGTKCQGDCTDTIYAKATLLVKETLCNKTHLPCPPQTSSHLSRKAGDAIYVVGVIHSATGQSLYSSITAYDYPKLASVGSFIDATLAGSADVYLGKDHPASKYLYVAKFARSCSKDDSDLCYEIPEHSDKPDVSPLALDSPIVFIERCYVNPATKAAPAVDETLLPLLIHSYPKTNELPYAAPIEAALF